MGGAVNGTSRPRRLPLVRARRVEGVVRLYRDDLGWDLSEVGALIWSRCDGRHTLDDIAAEIAATYEVSAQQASADVLEFVSGLVESRLVECP